MKRKIKLNANPADNSADLRKRMDATDTDASLEAAKSVHPEKSPHRGEGLFRALVENSPDGIVVVDSEGRIQFANSACGHLVGLEPEELIGQIVFTLLHTDDARNLRETHSHFVQNPGTAQSAEMRVLHRDGSWRTVEGIAKSFLDESGKIAVVSVLRDITARRQAEEASAESEELFRRLSEAIFDGMIIHEDGCILDINQNMLDIFGYERSEVIGRFIWEFVSPESGQLIQDRLHQGYEKSFEITAVRKDGSTFPAEVVGRDCRFQGRAARVVALRDISERKQAEQALNESEERFHTLIQSAFDGLVIHQDNRVVEASPSFAQMLGRELSEIIGRSAMEFATPESAQRMERNAANGYEKLYEAAFVRRDGSTVPLEILGKSCLYRGRKARVVAFRDLTEQKRMAEALRESQERMRSVLENSPDLITSVDAKGNIVFANRMLRQYREEKVIGSSIYRYTRPMNKDLLRNSLAQVFASGTPARFEIAGPGEGDRTSWYEVRVGPIRRDGRIVNAIVIASDITERRRMQDALAESEARFRAIATTARDAIILADGEGNISYWNPAAEEMLGYTSEEAVGRNLTVLVPDWLRETHRGAYFGFGRTGQGTMIGRTVEFAHVVRRDGSPLGVEVSVSALRIKDQWHVLGIMRDITQRKQMERELTEYRDQLERLVAERTSELERANELLRQKIAEHEQTEQALRASENKYRVLVENLPQKIFLKDRTSVYISCNEGYARDLKIRVEEIAGRTDYDFYPKELAEKYRADDHRIIEAGEAEETDERYVQDGKEMSVHTAKTPIRDEQGRVSGLLGIFWDITERKRTEEALRDSEERFRNLTDLLPQTVFEVDLKGHLTFANRFGFESSGYTPEDLARGLDSLQLFIPEDRNRVKKNVRRRLKGEVIGGIEYTTLRKDGSTFPVLTYSSPIIREGRPVGLRGIAVDITERKQAEETLRKSEHELRALLEATHDAACLTDPEGNLIALNENFASRFGRQADELVGTNIFDLLPSELAESRRKRADEAISSRQCVYAEDERDGRFMHTSYCPIFDDKGDLIRFAVFASDITEQRQAEERIRQLQRQQMETDKLAATGRMAARIAHEINNPLGGIKNSFDLIKDAIPKEHRHYDYVGRIEKEIERITRIVRQMIDLHRPYIALSRRFRVDETIRDIVALLEHNLLGNSVLFETHAEDARVTVTMSEDSLRQVVNNVVQNAIEASPEGGIVRIHAEVTGKTLVITVRDQGKGIPEDARLQIYEPFYTTKSSRQTGGLGLGLSIAKNLVEAMNGSLDFESTIGQGTTFTIMLPIETSQKEARNG